MENDYNDEQEINDFDDFSKLLRFLSFFVLKKYITSFIDKENIRAPIFSTIKTAFFSHFIHVLILVPLITYFAEIFGKGIILVTISSVLSISFLLICSLFFSLDIPKDWVKNNILADFNYHGPNFDAKKCSLVSLLFSIHLLSPFLFFLYYIVPILKNAQ